MYMYIYIYNIYVYIIYVYIYIYIYIAIIIANVIDGLDSLLSTCTFRVISVCMTTFR